jgi:hypothetical protein
MIISQFIINSIKYKRNKVLLEIIEKQSKILKLKMVLMYRIITFNAEYTETLKIINGLEERQVMKYDVMLEYDINMLMDKLNTMQCDTKSIDSDIAISETEVVSATESLRSLNSMVKSYTTYSQYVQKKNDTSVNNDIVIDID